MPPTKSSGMRRAVILPTSAIGPRTKLPKPRRAVASRRTADSREMPLPTVRIVHTAADPIAGTTVTASTAAQTASPRLISMPHCHFSPTAIRSPAKKSTAAAPHERSGAAREAVAPGRHRRDLAPFRRIAGLDPVVQQIAEIGEGVALGAHVPVEHRLGPPGIGAIEQAIVESIVVVQQHSAAGRGQ